MVRRKIVIIGGGPIGLEAALYGHTLGHEVVLFERHVVGAGMIAWGFLQMLTPWKLNTTPLGLKVVSKSEQWTGPLAELCPTAAEFRQRYLLPLATKTYLRPLIRENTIVLAVGREDFGQSSEAMAAHHPQFRVLNRSRAGREGVEMADVVLDCSGTYGRHRWAGCAGIPAPGEQACAHRIWYTIPDVMGRDRARFADRHTLLIGWGYPAAAVLFGLQQLQQSHPRTRVTWVMRRPKLPTADIPDDPLPARRAFVEFATQLMEKPKVWLQVLGEGAMATVIDAHPFHVDLKCTHANVMIHPDEIVAMVGYTPDTGLFENTRIEQVFAAPGPIRLTPKFVGMSSEEHTGGSQSLASETLVNPEPNLYILGAKSYGTNGDFTLQVGFHQIRDVYQLIGGLPFKDLYAVNESSA